MEVNLSGDPNPKRFLDTGNWQSLVDILCDTNRRTDRRADAAAYLVWFCDSDGAPLIEEALRTSLRDCPDATLHCHLQESLAAFELFRSRTQDVDFLLSTVRDSDSSFVRANALEFLKPYADGPRGQEIRVVRDMVGLLSYLANKHGSLFLVRQHKRLCVKSVGSYVSQIDSLTTRGSRTAFRGRSRSPLLETFYAYKYKSIWKNFASNKRIGRGAASLPRGRWSRAL